MLGYMPVGTADRGYPRGARWLAFAKLNNKHQARHARAGSAGTREYRLVMGGLPYVDPLTIDEPPNIKYDWVIGKRLEFSCTVLCEGAQRAAKAAHRRGRVREEHGQV